MIVYVGIAVILLEVYLFHRLMDIVFKVTERYTAKDGTKVPISLVYRKDINPKGDNPLLIYGYGSYGYSMDDYFSSARLSLLDRGFIYAIAHIRGGQEMGRYWYEDGKLLKKKNKFRHLNHPHTGKS